LSHTTAPATPAMTLNALTCAPIHSGNASLQRASV
jgi:hypothetical protein